MSSIYVDAAAGPSGNRMPDHAANTNTSTRRWEPEYPISYWKDRLIGKRLVSDAEKTDGDDTTFKKSDLPQSWRYLRGAHDARFIRDRLNKLIDNNNVVEDVNLRMKPTMLSTLMARCYTLTCDTIGRSLKRHSISSNVSMIVCCHPMEWKCINFHQG